MARPSDRWVVGSENDSRTCCMCPFVPLLTLLEESTCSLCFDCHIPLSRVMDELFRYVVDVELAEETIEKDIKVIPASWMRWARLPRG